MKRGALGMAVVALIVAATALAQAPPEAKPDSGSAPAATPAKAKPKASARGNAAKAPAGLLRVKQTVLGIRHRAIHDFYDEVTAKVGEEFTVGDSRYTARILRFVPDFGIDMKTHQVFSKSDRLDNPAFQIATAEGGVPHDTSWAFLNFAPHFSKKALLAFQVLRIEFENHAPVTPKDLAPVDTTGTRSGKR